MDLFLFGKDEVENTILVTGFDLILVDSFRKGELPMKPPVGPLDLDVMFLWGLFDELPFSFNDQRILFHLDIDFTLAHLR